jgi:hypothetical protein
MPLEQTFCDDACPNSYSDNNAYLSNLGCLPEYYDVQQMKEQGIVWMCHSNPTIPCKATGYLKVPDGMIPQTAM